MLGMNVDYRHWPLVTEQQRIAHDLVNNLQCKVVRTVLKPQEEKEWNSWYNLLRNWSIRLCAVKAKESGPIDQYKNYRFDYIQTGNESFNDGPSSYTQSADELNIDLRATRQIFPNTYHVCAGLADGDPTHLDELELRWVDAIAAHPGIETLDTIDYYISNYLAHGKGKPLILTEFYDINLVRKLRNHPSVHGAFFFCYDDKMVAGHGLLNHNVPKQQYHQFIAQLKDEGSSTVTALNVGAGIIAEMERQNDFPIRDSEWNTNQDGSVYEKGFGQKGFYEASNASGAWEVYFHPYPLV